MPVAQKKATAQPQQQVPQENVTLSNDGIGWGDAAVGLVSGLAGGVVTGVGAGLTSIKHSIIGTGEAYKALWTNETIGPVLKTALGAVLPIATVGVPVLSALGGAAVGLYQGFVDGATEGLSKGVAGKLTAAAAICAAAEAIIAQNAGAAHQAGVRPLCNMRPDRYGSA